MVLERVSASLRGELTRWLLEPKAGVFVGTVSAMVRDRLWEKACGAVRSNAKDRSGGAVLIYRADTEQGFAIRTHGRTTREVVDFEGLFLVRIPD